MATCFRLTGIATLLIGLQLFSPGKALGILQPAGVQTLDTNSFLVNLNENTSIHRGLINNSADEYQPPSKGGSGGPKRTQGAGRR